MLIVMTTIAVTVVVNDMIITMIPKTMKILKSLLLWCYYGDNDDNIDIDNDEYVYS